MNNITPSPQPCPTVSDIIFSLNTRSDPRCPNPSKKSSCIISPESYSYSRFQPIRTTLFQLGLTNSDISKLHFIYGNNPSPDADIGAPIHAPCDSVWNRGRREPRFNSRDCVYFIFEWCHDTHITHLRKIGKVGGGARTMRGRLSDYTTRTGDHIYRKIYSSERNGNVVMIAFLPMELYSISNITIGSYSITPTVGATLEKSLIAKARKLKYELTWNRNNG
jgi:hypothetical protein